MFGSVVLKQLLKSSAISCIVLFCIGASSCSGVLLKPDEAMAAIEAGDATVIIEGCGSQPVVGYTYCRVSEGDTAGLKIRIHVPHAQCSSKPCVSWKVFFPNGEPSLGGGIPEGQTTVDLLWKDLIKKDVFGVGDRGFWPILLEVRWIDKDKRERTSFAEGEIRLRVLRKSYTALHEIKDDKNFAWTWSANGRVMRYTTGIRAYTGANK